jgi:hypothetical protein
MTGPMFARPITTNMIKEEDGRIKKIGAAG